jgi:hypothetical protein
MQYTEHHLPEDSTALFLATTVTTSPLTFAWAVLVLKQCLLVGNLCLTVVTMTTELNTQEHAMF